MRTPPEFLQTLNGYWATCTLIAAVELDIIPALGNGLDTAEGLADRIHADRRGVTALLDALTAMNLLEKENNRYRASELGRQCLHPDSPLCLADIVRHHSHLAESWIHLADAVRSGKPNRTRVNSMSDEARRDFLLGMFNLASLNAPAVLNVVDLSSRRRLLDLGGGPGTYALRFCTRYPDLSAVVFDLPATRPVAEKVIARAGLSDRIRFQAGNFLDDDLGGPYDVVWASHVLHGESPTAAAALVKRAARVLEPGGRLIIHEFILDADRSGPLYPALFSLNMLQGTESGQAYSQTELRTMLEDAGCTQVTYQALPGPSALISATRF